MQISRSAPGRWGSSRRARRSLAVTCVAVSLLAAACSSSGSGSSGSSGGNVTLVIQNGDGGATGLLAAYAELNKEFEAKHPGVKIDFVTKSFDQVVSTAKLQLSGNNPPDVTQTNQGYQAMGAFVKAGLLVKLDSYAAKYGWNTRQASTLLALNGHFSSDGVTMGQGPLWGISVTNAWVGLLMNMDVAAKLGITQPPATFADLQQDLATAKAKGGTVPFEFGSQNGEMPAWLLSNLLLAQGGPSAVSGIVFHAPGASLQTATSAWAGQMMQTWAKNGYFTPSWAAFQTADVFNKFAKGEGLFTLVGSWYMPMPGSAAATKQFRMVVFPSVSGSGPDAVAAGDMPWTIPTHSKHHDLAAEYINFVSGAVAADKFIASGNMPSFSPTDLQAQVTAANLPVPSADSINNGLAVVNTGHPVPFVDWGAPDLYNAIKAGFDKLVSGSLPVSQWQSQLQAAYGPFVASLG
jgi:raffinose/stachyose/melibiose transport system substrate-binding protein